MAARVASLQLACLLLLAFSTSASAGIVEFQQAALRAAVWLESVQNLDGSWGSDPATRVVYTSAVVEGLRDQGRRGNAYHRGVTWLENHTAENLDARARRISALLPHGDSLSSDRAELVAGFRPIVGLGSGWGLTGAYGPSALDTALVLIAFADLGVPPDATLVQAGLDYLKASRTADNCWAVRGGTAADPIITSVVVRALKRYVAFDSTVTAVGTAAASRLFVLVTGSNSGPDRQAHAALARLSWYPDTTTADGLLNALVGSQDAEGSWYASIYVTAVALRGLATRLGHNAPNLQAVVPFADYGLRSAINLSLGRNRGDAIRRGELRSIASLNARGFGIRDLSSLAELTSLAWLDLRDNEIADVTTLLGIATLQTVLLQGNPWSGQLCDINDDTRVDSADVMLATRVARGDVFGSPVEMLLRKTRADVGPTWGPGDGLVDAGDAAVLVRAAAGTQVWGCTP